MILPVPIFVCASPEGPLLTAVNGRIVGETTPNGRLSFPLGEGVHYLTFTPLYAGALPMAKRVAILGGQIQPTPDGCDQAGLTILSWPGGVHDLTIHPPHTPAYSPARRRVLDSARFEDAYGTHRAQILDQGVLVLDLLSDDGASLSLVPACAPETGHMRAEVGSPSIVTLAGPTPGGGEYRLIIARTETGWDVLFDGTGDSVLPPETGALRVLSDLRDTVGHGILSSHALQNGRYRPVEIERIWYQGRPNWPTTAFGTACAFVEAACLGEEAEAAGYLAPDFRGQPEAQTLLTQIRAYESWVEPRYQPSNDPVTLGLVRSLEPGRKVADVFRFNVAPARDNTQGAFHITGVTATDVVGG